MRAISVVSLGGSSVREKEWVDVECTVAHMGASRANCVMRSTDCRKDRPPTCANSGSSCGGSALSVCVVSLRSWRSWSCVVVANTADRSWMANDVCVRVCEHMRSWCNTSRATRVCVGGCEADACVPGNSMGWTCMWSSRLCMDTDSCGP
jgi:hypothetical protein